MVMRSSTTFRAERGRPTPNGAGLDPEQAARHVELLATFERNLRRPHRSDQ
jgi:hypothetical protein